MKTRYLLPLASLVLATSAFAASACDGPRHPGRHEGPPSPGAFIEHMDKRAELNLSAAQKQKLKALGEAERARHEAIRKESQAQFDAVLTPEQRAKLDVQRQEAREKHAERLDKRAEQIKERAEKLREHKDAPAR